MAALPQFDYIFAIATIFAFLDAWNIGMFTSLPQSHSETSTPVHASDFVSNQVLTSCRCKRCRQLFRDFGRLTLAYPQASHVYRLRHGVCWCHACRSSCH